ncbi:MAG: flagellar basal-body rod protein FlgF [Syntrophomonadaceae bacterium]|nr:flagellar basal-body rod protein FlgF [Syntrophomonadaceae bacterium]MDD3897407.1 flagellar basal-body rod protein FlgF [Syntrophomonadaceae bacterium]
MIKGLYTAGAGMMLQMARQDVVANNLANVNTGGYKKQIAVAQAFPNMLISRLGEIKKNIEGEYQPVPVKLIGGLGTGAAIEKIYTDFTMGNIRKTDNATDLALNSDGYFAVLTPQGERYTRNGQFKINNEGILTTNQGYPVLDTGDQPISLEGEFSIDEMGNISVNGESIARLKMVRFENPQYLERQGDNLVAAQEEAGTILERPGILQGYTEDSNINAVKEMVELINVVRAYESMQKVVQAEDETTQVAIDQVGSVS